MDKDGYRLFHLSPQERHDALACLHETSIDYKGLKQFIDGPLLRHVQQVPGATDPVYVKFRMSNNNNSNDAAVSHSDVYNFCRGPMPMYTCVCYLDKAELEVYPGSHTNPRPPMATLKPRVLYLEAGTLVVFPASLLHRGVHFSKGKNRRVLQVFEIFPTKVAFEAFLPRLLTVDYSRGKNRQKSALYYIAQHKPLVDMVNAVILRLVYFDVQYKVTGNDLPPWRKQGRYISYEPGGRISYSDDLTQPWNINVVVEPHATSSGSSFYLGCYAALVVALALVYTTTKKNKK